MTAPKRTEMQREADLQIVSELYLKQWTQEKIAAYIAELRRPLGYEVSQQQISLDIKAIQKRWQKSEVMNFNEAKQRELERIDVLEREYWEAWIKSQEPRKIASRKISNDGTVETQSSEVRNGDPRYLAGIQWCIEQRCKILGVEAPKRTELTGADGKPIPIVITKMDINEL